MPIPPEIDALLERLNSELLEMLELAKLGEQKLKEVAEMATALAQKCQRWHEAKQSIKQ